MNIDWKEFKNSGKQIVAISDCPYYHKIVGHLGNIPKDCIIFEDKNRKYIGTTFANQKITSPSIIVLDKKGKQKGVVIGSDQVIRHITAHHKKNNSFGYFLKPNKMVPEKLGTGSSRPRGHRDYIPQPGWGGFSASAGLNRAGNAIPCGESANWLYTNRSAPKFPLAYGTKKTKTTKTRSNRTKKVVRKTKSSYGTKKVVRKTKKTTKRRKTKSTTRTKRKTTRSSYGMLPTLQKSFWDKRGRNGFEGVPKSIYQSGNVPVYSMSPYAGAPVGGTLPRPFGPRDNAAIKGYPAYPQIVEYNTRFGSAPFMNEGYNPRMMEQFGSGPFMNEGYNPQMGSGFGRDVSIPEMIGYTDAKPQFRPHLVRSWKPGYQEYANKGLYLPGWNPYQDKLGRTQSQKKIASGAKAISRRQALNVGFGSAFQGATPGPNNVTYRNPMLMYDGAGGNTINFLTGRQYYKPCRMPNKQFPKPEKVMKNNNPRGYLANAKTLKYLNNGFGSGGCDLSHVMMETIGTELNKYNEYVDIQQIISNVCNKTENRVDPNLQALISLYIFNYLFNSNFMKKLSHVENLKQQGTPLIKLFENCIIYNPDNFKIVMTIFSKINEMAIKYIFSTLNKNIMTKDELRYVKEQLTKHSNILTDIGLTKSSMTKLIKIYFIKFKNCKDTIQINFKLKPKTIEDVYHNIVQELIIDNILQNVDILIIIGNIFEELNRQKILKTNITESKNDTESLELMKKTIIDMIQNNKLFEQYFNTEMYVTLARAIRYDIVFRNAFGSLVNTHFAKVFNEAMKSEGVKFRLISSFGKQSKPSEWAYPKKPWVNASKGPYTTGLLNTGGLSTGAGFQRIGQPLELYTYLNTPYGGYQYPEFSGPRQFMGGYGSRKRSNTKKTKTIKVQKNSKSNKIKVKVSKISETANTRSNRTTKSKKQIPKAGDTIVIKKGKIKLIKNKSGK